MGFIRGALGVFASILLFIVFLAGGVLLTLTLSLQYENVYEHVSPLIQDTIQQEVGVDIPAEIEKEINSANISCENYPGEYNFTEQGFSLTISCDMLKNGTSAIINSGIEQIIKNIYYYDYTCSFWKCFSSSESPLPISSEQNIPLFLVSDFARNYWKSKFYLALTISIILMLSIFFLYKKKHNFLIVPGILLVAASLPFFKIESLVSISGDKIFFALLSIFLAKAKSVFHIFFFTGIGLIVSGIILKLFIIGFKLSNFFNKNKSEVNKQEKKIKKPEVIKENKPLKEDKVKKK